MVLSASVRGSGPTRRSVASKPTPTAPPTPICTSSRCRAEWGIDLYLKDESVHPTGSLKHRLARSLFLYGLCNGWITERTTIVEASSGSTAVSEAYFARFLGLPFVAVMPASTSPEKIGLIEAQGGSCHLVDDPRTMVAEARRLAAETGGHFLDQFTYAERAMDWRGNNNIAESIFAQMALERHPIPALGRGRRRDRRDERDDRPLRAPRPLRDAAVRRRSRGLDLLLALDGRPVDVHRPAVAHRGHRAPAASSRRSCPDVVDRMIQVPDAASIATMRLVRERTGAASAARPGRTSGARCCSSPRCSSRGERGSVVTLICDGGDRYAGTYYNDAWVADQGLELAPYTEALETLPRARRVPRGAGRRPRPR